MSSAPSLVLRTLYISPELDNKLRAEAYDRRTSKNDVIRGYLEYAIEQKKKERIQVTATSKKSETPKSTIKRAVVEKAKSASKKSTVRKAAAKKNA
jgi:hypothetical protein